MSYEARSIGFPLAITLLAGIAVAWQLLTEHVMRVFAVPFILLLWLLLWGIWWVVGPRKGKLKRLAILVGLFVGGFFVITQTVRYEGSASGSALPSLSWKWSKEEVRELSVDAPDQAGSWISEVEGAEPALRFMGPEGDGQIKPIAWSPDWAATAPREAWRIEVGEGWSGFVVDGGRAITQEQRGDKECVVCYELATGRMLWLQSIEERFDEAMSGLGPRATPALDPQAGLVYAQGAGGDLHCLNVEDGSVKWTVNVLEDVGAPNMEWGKANAPLLDQGRVIVTGGKPKRGDSGRPPTPTLLAYDATTGEKVWQAGEEASGYASPVVRTLDGVAQLVSVNQYSVTGHDRKSGAVLWRFDWPGEMPKVGQPISVTGKLMLVTASYGMDSHLLEVSKSGSGWTVDAKWSEGSPRTKFSSASVIGDYIYALDEGRLACISLASGERVWRDGRFGYGQHLLCGDDLLLIQSEPGEVVLVQASPDGLNVLTELPALSSKTWNPPTLAGRWLLVRNDKEAICFELPAAKGRPQL